MPTTALIAGGLGAAGSIGAAAIGANAQVGAENKAIQAEQQMLQQGENYANTQLGTASNILNPFINAGGSATNLLSYLTGGSTTAPTGTTTNGMASGALTAPFSAANLLTTPGYQFTLGQGLESTQNSFASQGLGSSGAAEKGAASYATGLANNTYNQQFTNYLTQNAQIANILGALTSTGSGAANTLASLYGNVGAAGLGGSVTTGGEVGNALTGQGNAIAGAATGSANALTSGLNSYLQYNLLSNLLSNSSGSMASQVNGYNAYMGNFQNALASSSYFGG